MTYDLTRAAYRILERDRDGRVIGEHVLTEQGWAFVPGTVDADGEFTATGEPQRGFLSDALAACGSSEDHEKMDAANRVRWEAVDRTRDLLLDLINRLAEDADGGETIAATEYREAITRLVDDLADGNKLCDTRTQGQVLREPVKPSGIRRYYAIGAMPTPTQVLGRSPVQTLGRVERWDAQRPGKGWRGRQRAADESGSDQ